MEDLNGRAGNVNDGVEKYIGKEREDTTNKKDHRNMYTKYPYNNYYKV